MIKKKILIVFLCFVFLSCILIYGMGNQKNLGKKTQEIFNENSKEEIEMINNLELFENFDMLANLDFFEDVLKESK